MITLREYPAELDPRERFLRLANEAKSIAYWGAETDDPMPEDDMFLRAAMGLGQLARMQSGCDTAALMVCLLASTFTKYHDGPPDGARARIVGQVLDDPAAAMPTATADAVVTDRRPLGMPSHAGADQSIVESVRSKITDVEAQLAALDGVQGEGVGGS